MPDRLANRVFFAPPGLQSLGDNVWRPSNAQTPLAAGKGFTIKRYGLMASLITALHRAICPPAIVRLVVSVDVNPVYGSVFRALTHVGKKVLKRLFPSVANCNSSSSVLFKFRVVRVEASLNHGTPSVVGACPEITMFGHFFSVDAPARLSVSPSQSVCRNNDRAAASAFAQPSRVLFSGINVADNSKSAKGLTGKVFESCHFVTSKLITVKKAWQAAVIQLFGSYPSQAGAFYHG